MSKENTVKTINDLISKLENISNCKFQFHQEMVECAIKEMLIHSKKRIMLS